jgi:hypothetical protein
MGKDGERGSGYGQFTLTERYPAGPDAGKPALKGPVDMSMSYVGCITVMLVEVGSLRSVTFRFPH